MNRSIRALLLALAAVVLMTIGPVLGAISAAGAHSIVHEAPGGKTGTLSPSRPFAAYETTLEEGYVRINITLTNRGPSYSSVSAALYLWAKRYVPWLGEDVEYWHRHREDWVWLMPNESRSIVWETLVVASGRAKIAVRLSTATVIASLRVDYDIKVECLFRRADYVPMAINSTTPYTWSRDAENALVFRIDVPEDRFLNITVEQTAEKVVVPVVKATLWVWTSGLNEGDEKLEVYLNGRYVGDVVSADDNELPLPVKHLLVPGWNELKFVYREIGAGADGLELEGFRVRLVYADGVSYHLGYSCYALMDEDGEERVCGFYVYERRKTAYVSYVIRNLDTGRAIREFWLYGNESCSTYVYMLKGSYCLIAKRNYNIGIELDISLSTPESRLIEPGSSIELTFHRDRYREEVFLLEAALEADWTHLLELEIVEGDDWEAWATGLPYELELYHVNSTTWNERYRRYLDTLWAAPVSYTHLTLPTTERV